MVEAKRPPKKKPGRKPGPDAPTPRAVVMVAQPHGGALRYGGELGNTPGTGRPPDEIKRQIEGLAAEGVLEALPGIIGIAKGSAVQKVMGPDGVELEGVLVSAPPRDRISAFDSTCKVAKVLPQRDDAPGGLKVTFVVAFE